MNKDECIASVFLLLTAGAAVHESIQLRIGTIRNQGPGFLPFCLGIVLAVLVILYVLTEYFQASSRTSTKKPFSLGPNWKKAAGVLLCSFLYILILWDFLGFLISTPIFLFTIMWLTGSARVRGNLIVTVFLTLFSYLLFKTFLQCTLPEGLLKGVLSF